MTSVLRERDVVVRPAEPRDAAAVAALREDRDVRRWLPHPDGDPDGDPVGVGGSTPDPVHRFVIEVGGAFAGAVSLRPDGAGGGWLTCAAPPAARGSGTTATAVRLVLTWAFVELGLQAVHWRSEVGAWPARRLAWACGSSLDGVVRCLLPVDGDRRDAWVGTWRWDEPLRPRQRWLVPVELAGGGVRLGPHVPGDVTRIAEACSAASTQRWLPSLPSPYTVLDAATWVAGREEEQASGAGVFWAVRADALRWPDGGRDGGPGDGPGAEGPGPVLAEVGLFGLADGARSGEVGYWCHPDARRRGVTTAAVRLVARHALSPVAEGGLGLERVVLRVARGNRSSRRVAVACGFRAVGVDRRAERLRDGTAVDFVRYDLLAEEVAAEVLGGASDQTGRMSTPAPGDPSLRRVTVVVDVDADAGTGLDDLAVAVAAQLPWDQLPAMADTASREAAVVAAPDSGSLEVVLLVEAVTDEQAEARALASLRDALRGAGLSSEAVTPSQVVVQDAYAL